MKKKLIEEILEHGRVIAHDFVTYRSGSNYDIQLINYNDELYIINKKNCTGGLYDDLKNYQEFWINGLLSSMYSKSELLAL